jgi:hypothetical protein
LGYAKKTSVTNTLAIDVDSDFSNAPITTLSEYPSGVDNLHNRLSLYYSDGSKTTYDNYIIDDEGNIGPVVNGNSNRSTKDVLVHYCGRHH